MPAAQMHCTCKHGEFTNFTAYFNYLLLFPEAFSNTCPDRKTNKTTEHRPITTSSSASAATMGCGYMKSSQGVQKFKE
jgi:hypothetical protein